MRKERFRVILAIATVHELIVITVVARDLDADLGSLMKDSLILESIRLCSCFMCLPVLVYPL